MAEVTIENEERHGAVVLTARSWTESEPELAKEDLGLKEKQ